MHWNGRRVTLWGGMRIGVWGLPHILLCGYLYIIGILLCYFAADEGLLAGGTDVFAGTTGCCWEMRDEML